MFVTAVYAILDTLNGKLVYANAGHNMPLLLKGRSGIVEPLPRGGMAMGVIEEYTLENFELTLEVYDTLLFYTDGVSETFSPDNEMFGETRLEGMLAGMNRKPVAEILNKIDDELAAFRNGNTLTDDITMVGVRRLEQKDL
jgi:serine phosphatase RsbU (regulator of sigma subunit)